MKNTIIVLVGAVFIFVGWYVFFKTPSIPSPISGDINTSSQDTDQLGSELDTSFEIEPITKYEGDTEYVIYEGQVTVTGEYELVYGLGAPEIIGFTLDEQELSKLPPLSKNYVGLLLDAVIQTRTINDLEREKERMFELFSVSTELQQKVAKDPANCSLRGSATIVIRNLYKKTNSTHEYPTVQLIQVLKSESPKLQCNN